MYMKNQNPKTRICVCSQKQRDEAHTDITSHMLITKGIAVSNVLFHRTARTYIPSQRSSSNDVSSAGSPPHVKDNHDSTAEYTFSIMHEHW